MCLFALTTGFQRVRMQGSDGSDAFFQGHSAGCIEAPGHLVHMGGTEINALPRPQVGVVFSPDLHGFKTTGINNCPKGGMRHR